MPVRVENNMKVHEQLCDFSLIPEIYFGSELDDNAISFNRLNKFLLN